VNDSRRQMDRPLSSLAVANVPWVFTQRPPLGGSGVIDEMKLRGVSLDIHLLRELYKHRLLEPMLYIGNRRATHPIEIATEEPSGHSILPAEYRRAREAGWLQDLASTPFRPRLRFTKGTSAPLHWWNGLLYSRYQLLVLSQLSSALKNSSSRWRGGRIVKYLKPPDEADLLLAVKFRRIALALTALEARYLPVLDQEWIHLSNTDGELWERYRADFDPVATSKQLGYSAQEARADAEFLLLRAGGLDPLDDNWRHLVCWAPRDQWRKLKDAALEAMELREAAEILLRFYEDVVSRGQADPLPEFNGRNSWHPLVDRLSTHPKTLDQDLMGLGLSPHPRVILAVEGESEQHHVPRIWEALGFRPAPELVRVLKLGGVDRDLEKVAALAAAPLVGTRSHDGRYWNLIKPPTRLLVAVDPEGKYFGSPQRIEKTRKAILDEIRAVLAAQGAEGADADLEETIEIHTWSASCYEFAHFDDTELATAIASVHQTCNGLSRGQLEASLVEVRNRNRDIKEVWSSWDYKVSKGRLAEALWPALERRIVRLRAGDDLPVPEIAEIVNHAYLTASRWRYGSFILRARTDEA
jgi:hypothetical protein